MSNEKRPRLARDRRTRTRTGLAFKKKLEDQLALESLNAQVQKLKQDAEIDDLAAVTISQHADAHH